MKTEIIISGQISGNHKLRSAIVTAECQERKGMFYSIILTFPTKKAAKKALSTGYQYMIREMPEEKKGLGGINYSRGYSLAWDASIAKISEP